MFSIATHKEAEQQMQSVPLTIYCYFKSRSMDTTHGKANLGINWCKRDANESRGLTCRRTQSHLARTVKVGNEVGHSGRKRYRLRDV